MLNKFIFETIKKNFPFQPTRLQNTFFEKISEYLVEREMEKLLIIRGYAGTGKTTVIASLVKAMHELKMRVVLLAPTGRAAKVFSEYAEFPAWTVHKYIYRQSAEEDGEGSFVLDFNKSKDTLFIVDEASMLSDENTFSPFGSGCLLSDLFHFIFNSQNNNKLLLVGDTAQLPPVGLEVSHALDANYISQNFHFDVEELVLTEVLRQEADSGILKNATDLRQQLLSKDVDRLVLTEADDVKHINGGELIEELNDAYNRNGFEETIVITRSNKRANAYNNGIRQTLLDREEEFCSGDLIMVVKNNYYWKDSEKKIDFIANGEIAEVVKFRKMEEMYGFRFADVVLRFVNYDVEVEAKILIDTLMAEAPSLSRDDLKRLYYSVMEDYQDLKSKKKRQKALRENPYFNALQVKFAYAITCHKSQGGQWDTVFVDQGYLTDDMLGNDYCRWLYTAITRAKKKLYFVNFQDKYKG